MSGTIAAFQAVCAGRWERAAVLRPSQYLDVAAFFVSVFNPSGT